MTREAFTPTPVTVINGVGPYTVEHPYREGALRLLAVQDGVITELATSEYGVVPVASDTTGAVTLTGAAATAYDGQSLYIQRLTFVEQGFSGQNAREKGFEVQLDWVVEAVQDQTIRTQNTLRSLDPNFVGDLPAGVPNGAVVFNATADGLVVGPSTEDIAVAQDYAATAQAAQAAAVAAVLGVPVVRGAWQTGALYGALQTSLVTFDGSAYVSTAEHVSGVFATDLAAGLWEMFVTGSAGALLQVNDLSDLNSAAVARTNLGLGAAALMGDSANPDLSITPDAAARRGIVRTAIAAGASFDPNAEWQTMVSSRAAGVIYENDTGYAILLFVSGSSASPLRGMDVSTTGAFAGEEVQVGYVGGQAVSSHPIIPNGSFYRLDGAVASFIWNEFRSPP